jgi:hypothetical protein
MRITSKRHKSRFRQRSERRPAFRPGDEVEFVIEDGKILMRRSQNPKHETRGQRAVRVLSGTGKWPEKSTDEIMRLLRGDPDRATFSPTATF